MKLLTILKWWLCCAWVPVFFDTNSSSSANQTQTTDTQDNRIAAAQDSVNLNNSRGVIGGNVTVISTDHGAVDGALKFANAAGDTAAKLTDSTVSKAFDFAGQVAHGAATENAAALGAVQASAQGALSAVQSAYQDESKTLSDAYTTAKAGEQKVLVAGVFAVLGLVAIKVFGKAA
jgi:hypothetical protein